MANSYFADALCRTLESLINHKLHFSLLWIRVAWVVGVDYGEITWWWWCWPGQHDHLTVSGESEC